MDAKTFALRPRASEKSYAASQALNTYVFDVPGSANKQQVAAAIEAQYGVTVETVNIAIIKGKAKSTFSKRSRSNGRDTDVKKAYVRIKQEDHLPIFEAEEKEDAKAAKQAEKAAKKEKK